MCEKTAREYRKSGKFPSQRRSIHDWAIHEDIFKDNWPWVEEFLKNNHSLEAKTLFEALQREKIRANTKTGNCGRSNGV